MPELSIPISALPWRRLEGVRGRTAHGLELGIACIARTTGPRPVLSRTSLTGQREKRLLKAPNDAGIHLDRPLSLLEGGDYLRFCTSPGCPANFAKGLTAFDALLIPVTADANDYRASFSVTSI